MSLRVLAASISRAFVEKVSSEFTVVQKVKHDQLRDVVTPLDEHLHQIAEGFVASMMPGTRLLSEEGELTEVSAVELATGDFLVVDPLDGSNNVALGLPGFGFMAGHLRAGVLVGAVVVVPEQDLYLVVEGGELVTSQPVQLGAQAAANASASVYYAYPPHLSERGRVARGQVLDVIDARTSGVYRSGSACIGLFNLISGRHAAFVAHHVRLWDALGFFPVLSQLGYEVRYRVTPGSIVLVASLSQELCEDLAQALAADLEGPLSSFQRNNQVVVCDD